MFNFNNSGLYEPQPDDEFFTPTAGAIGDNPQPVNLNAITYYARLGLKPKRIAILVGTSHTTIWGHNRLRQAYEDGAAFLEVELRTTLLKAAEKDGVAAHTLLNRVAGSTEQDLMDGISPEEQGNGKGLSIRLEISDNSTNPEVEDLKKLLDRRVTEALKQ